MQIILLKSFYCNLFCYVVSFGTWFLKIKFKVEINFTKVEFYAIQQYVTNVELNFLKLEFYILLYFIDFGKIEFHVRTQLS